LDIDLNLIESFVLFYFLVVYVPPPRVAATETPLPSLDIPPTWTATTAATTTTAVVPVQSGFGPSSAEIQRVVEQAVANAMERVMATTTNPPATLAQPMEFEQAFNSTLPATVIYGEFDSGSQRHEWVVYAAWILVAGFVLVVLFVYRRLYEDQGSDVVQCKLTFYSNSSYSAL